jgi:hypothetical protein
VQQGNERQEVADGSMFNIKREQVVSIKAAALNEDHRLAFQDNDGVWFVEPIHSIDRKATGVVTIKFGPHSLGLLVRNVDETVDVLRAQPQQRTRPGREQRQSPG